ncbi:MAG: DUF2937 family protein [Pseudomonadota bacterium]
MILRSLALAFGLAGAALLSQFPEFAQQYLQRLAGKVDQLDAQVASIDASAARFDMTRAAYLADLSLSRTGAEAAARAAAEVALHARLAPSLAAFREAGALGRLTLLPQVADLDLARRTLGDYRPALPLTVEGAGFAAVGFAAGWGVWTLAWALVAWPFRRRRRRRTVPPAPSAAAEAEDGGEEDAPLVEYEGHISPALGQPLPALALAAHDGTRVDLGMLSEPAVLFSVPLLGRPGVAYPDDWEEVDGSADATALACSFRDNYDEVRRAGIGEVFGLSPQSPGDLAEAAHRLALPYTLLSDPRLSLSFALDLPRFILHHERYQSASVLVVQGGRVLAALHPVHDAARAAPRLLAKLAEARRAHQKDLQTA